MSRRNKKRLRVKKNNKPNKVSNNHQEQPAPRPNDETLSWKTEMSEKDVEAFTRWDEHVKKIMSSRDIRRDDPQNDG